MQVAAVKRQVQIGKKNSTNAITGADRGVHSIGSSRGAGRRAIRTGTSPNASTSRNSASE